MSWMSHSRCLATLRFHLKGIKEMIWLKNNPKEKLFLTWSQMSATAQPHGRGGHEPELREGQKKGGFHYIAKCPVATSPGCLGCNASEPARNFGNSLKEAAVWREAWRPRGKQTPGTAGGCPPHGCCPHPAEGRPGWREGRGGCTAAAKGTTPFTARSQIWRTFGGGREEKRKGHSSYSVKKR